MTAIIHPAQIKQVILLIGGQRVLLDRDLAALYGAETKTLNQAVRRHPDRFPANFRFELTLDEAQDCAAFRFQLGLLKPGQNINYTQDDSPYYVLLSLSAQDQAVVWTSAVEFKTQTGKNLGFTLTREGEGSSGLEVCFESEPRNANRQIRQLRERSLFARSASCFLHEALACGFSRASHVSRFWLRHWLPAAGVQIALGCNGFPRPGQRGTPPRKPVTFPGESCAGVGGGASQGDIISLEHLCRHRRLIPQPRPKKAGQQATLRDFVRVPSLTLCAADARCLESIMGRKSLKVNDLLGALTQLDQFIANHCAPIIANGLTVALLHTTITSSIRSLRTKGQAREDAKAASQTATASLDGEMVLHYAEFSSLVSLLRGAVGNTTPAGKQLTNIRKPVTGGGSGSSSSSGCSSSSSTPSSSSSS